jgi:hypothetical protein
MPWIDSLDWSSLNSLRRYPIREGMSAASTDGLFSIPDTLIVDFTLCATSAVNDRFYISKIFNKLSSVSIEISKYDDASAVGSVVIDKTTHSEDQDYYITPTALYAGANGKITIGTMQGLETQPVGLFTFANTATEFEPRTIIPGRVGLTRLAFVDAANGEYSMTGTVTLASRVNLLFSYTAGQSTVVLDAGENLGLNKKCDDYSPIRSINGVLPDDTGNINLIGVDCMKISNSAQYTLDISDTCCTPCSGCSDLETLTSRLTSLENKFLDLKGSYSNASTQLSTYLTTVNSNCAC